MEMSKLEFQFIDASGRIIIKKKLTGLPLRENCVIAKSIEYFGDPEPCMIHRSAVVKAIYLEFYDYFEKLIRQGLDRQQWRCIPDDLRQMLDLTEDISYVSFCGQVG